MIFIKTLRTVGRAEFLSGIDKKNLCIRISTMSLWKGPAGWIPCIESVSYAFGTCIVEGVMPPAYHLASICAMNHLNTHMHTHTQNK